jgi:hypothetical protein
MKNPEHANSEYDIESVTKKILSKKKHRKGLFHYWLVVVEKLLPIFLKLLKNLNRK